MNLHTRRDFLQVLSGAGASMTGFTFRNAKTRATDIRIEDISFSLEEFKYRAPYKFGGVPVDRATIINVTCTVRAGNGKTANGFGSMPLGNVWAFPSRTMPYDTTLGAL